MQDIFADYSTWLHGLPLIVQPVVTAFTPSLPVWLAAWIYDRTYEAKHGVPPPIKKPSGWALLPFGLGLFYLRTRYPQVRAVIDYPDTHWPYFHAHWWQMLIGCLLAGVAAKWLAALYAAIFLRAPRPRRGSGVIPVPPEYTMLPTPLPGYDWFSKPKTRVRIFGTRTTHEE